MKGEQEEQSPPRRKNDTLWKGILEEVFEDLLRFVFKDADKELALERGFEFLDKELSEMYPEPEKPSHTRIADKLVKVYMRDGSERWMLIHVEVQGKNEPVFLKRMFQYYYRIFDRYDRPVTAVAIFTGRDGKNIPDRFEDHYLGTHLLYQFNTLCITDYPDEVLSASENPFAVVMLAAKKALLTGKDLDNKLFKQKMLIVKLLQEKSIFGNRKIGAILSFLHNYVLIKDPQINRNFVQQVDHITGKKNTMGIFEQLAEMRAQHAKEVMEKGIQKGKLEERKRSVELVLTNTELSMAKIASIFGVSRYFVNKVKAGLCLK